MRSGKWITVTVAIVLMIWGTFYGLTTPWPGLSGRTFLGAFLCALGGALALRVAYVAGRSR